MRLIHVLLAGALFVTSSGSFGKSQPLGTLWRSGRGSIIQTECPPGEKDDYCRAIKVQRDSKMVDLGWGYMVVTLLWSRKAEVDGPDVILLGDYGGSGGNADLIAITLSPNVSVRKLSGERFNSVAVRQKSETLRLSVPFDIEYFNGASHARSITVPLPAIWAGNDFALDFAEMTNRVYSASELGIRLVAMRAELNVWAKINYPAQHLYPPEARNGTPATALVIVEMMLSGHADQAHKLLDRAWPRDRNQPDRPLGGENEFWTALCKEVTKNPFWRHFGLAKLPHADLIESGARAAA